MSVHKEITKHVNNQHQTVKTFFELDEKREAEIEKVVAKAKAGEEFTTAEINKITEKINELAKIGITPQRKYVTPSMVLEYVSK